MGGQDLAHPSHSRRRTSCFSSRAAALVATISDRIRSSSSSIACTSSSATSSGPDASASLLRRERRPGSPHDSNDARHHNHCCGSAHRGFPTNWAGTWKTVPSAKSSNRSMKYCRRVWASFHSTSTCLAGTLWPAMGERHAIRHIRHPSQTNHNEPRPATLMPPRTARPCPFLQRGFESVVGIPEARVPA